MKQFVFIGAFGRSGTHLLRNILDSHSDIAAGPEFDFLPELALFAMRMENSLKDGRQDCYYTQEELFAAWRNFITSMLNPYADKHGASILVEKTPSNVWQFEMLSRIFPDAKFIHLVRDGRDCVASSLAVGKRFAEEGAPPSMGRDGALASATECGALWAHTVIKGLEMCAQGAPLQDRSITIKYEDMVRSPSNVIQELCSFLDVEFEETMLAPEQQTHDQVIDNRWVTDQFYTRPISTSSIDKWKNELSLEDKLRVRFSAQPALELLGYAENTDWAYENANMTDEALANIRLSIEKEVTDFINERCT